MCDQNLGGALDAASRDVLEGMFFAPGDGEEAEPEAWAGEIAARLEFHGEYDGFLAIRVPGVTARAMAADFLGEEEGALDDGQVGEVVCELANMICGSALSRAAPGGDFRLGAPSLAVFDGDCSPNAFSCTTATGHGPLQAILEVER